MAALNSHAATIPSTELGFTIADGLRNRDGRERPGW